MSRVNFYQLLELKINPPESDPKVIADAIRRKQAEWSRLRNHPTKGTHARQNISLLNEIRRVMEDSQLREEEARKALELLKKRLEAKFKIIDSHIQLLGAKGDVSESDMARLADFHKVKLQIIQRRVDRWRKKHGRPLKVHLNQLLVYGKPDDKTMDKVANQFKTSLEEVQSVLNELLTERLAELDGYINIQIRKGYMSETEISDLSAIYALDQGDILRRVRCPIRKDSSSGADHAHQLDSTVEQFINDNLNIVGQDSLYSFLGLFPGSPLEALQKKAVEKEKEIRQIAQKDAIITASGVLVGQCISIFKSDENRYAYDISRAKSLLKNLNQDIGLAAADHNRIRIEHYNHLLRKAVSFGTPPDKARQHILDFCQSKQWQVELPKKKLNLKRYATVAGLTLSVMVIGLAIFWFFYFSNQRLQDAYARTQKDAAAQPTLEAQIRVFEQFLANHDDETLSERANAQIESLRNRIVQRDFQKVTEAVESLSAALRFEDIERLYNDFLARHGDSSWAEKIRPQLAEIPTLIDQRDYRNLLDMPSDDPEAVAHAAVAYLQQHPEGAYVAPVGQLLKRVEPAYYRNVLKALDQCEAGGDWNQCIRLASRYIKVYRDSTSALKLRERRDQYQINLQNQAILEALVAKAGGADADPSALRETFEAFLRDSPGSPAASLVRRELGTISRRLGRQAAQQESTKLQQLYGQKKGRFQIVDEETVRDTKTGLTWALLDSRYLTEQCMTYDEARRFVKSMKLGGYTDWRLPHARELAALYQRPSPFEGTASDWYWSSDSFKRYAGEWIELVDVVRPLPQPSVVKENSKNCGWFRVVRP